MRPAIPPPATRCEVCHRVGHAASAHTDPEQAALTWARAVLVIARYRIEGGHRLLVEETAAYWSDATYEMIRGRHV